MNEITTTTVVPDEKSSEINSIITALTNKDVDPEKFKIYMELRGEYLKQEAELRREEARRAFSEAMVAAQAEMTLVARDGTNDGLKRKDDQGTSKSVKYATLGAITQMAQPIWTEHGFSISFSPEKAEEPNHIGLACYVRHKGGHTEKHKLELAVDPNARNLTHAEKSSNTYARRTLLCNIWNIADADEDDDGNAAGGMQRHERRAPPPPTFRHPETSKLGQIERKLAALWEEGKGFDWKQALCAAYQEATTLAGIDALEDLVKDRVADAPPAFRTDIATAVAEARKRLTPQLETGQPPPPPVIENIEVYVLLDHTGDEVSQHTSATAFASALVALWGKADEKWADELLGHNSDEIDRASRTDAHASEILSVLEPPLPPEADEAWAAEQVAFANAQTDRKVLIDRSVEIKDRVKSLKTNKPDLNQKIVSAFRLKLEKLTAQGKPA